MGAMDMDDGEGFPIETAKEKILTVLQGILGPTPFIHQKTSLWATTIIENILKELKEINENGQGGAGRGNSDVVEVCRDVSPPTKNGRGHAVGDVLLLGQGEGRTLHREI